MFLKKLNNEKGISLVEVIVSVAILTIISITFLNILTGSFSNTMEAGRSNKDYFEAAGELDIAIRNNDYTGKNSNLKIVPKNLSIFGESIESDIIYSKASELSTSIDVDNDPYIYAFTINKDSSYTNQAYIDVNNDGSFDEEDIIVTAEELNGSFIYLSSGTLVIPYQDSLESSLTNVDWYINDGIKVESNITINSSSEITMKSPGGQIDLVESILLADNDIELDANDNLLISSSDIDSENGSIKLYGDTIDSQGTDVNFMVMDVPLGQTIEFYSTKVKLNDFTRYYIDGVDDYAINMLGATYETDGPSDGFDIIAESPEKFKH